MHSYEISFPDKYVFIFREADNREYTIYKRKNHS